MSHGRRKPVLEHLRTTKAEISLLICSLTRALAVHIRLLWTQTKVSTEQTLTDPIIKVDVHLNQWNPTSPPHPTAPPETGFLVIQLKQLKETVLLTSEVSNQPSGLCSFTRSLSVYLKSQFQEKWKKLLCLRLCKYTPADPQRQKTDWEN